MESHAEYLDGVLPAREARRFDAHSASCRACGQYDRVLRRGLLLARNLPQVQPSAHFHEELQQRLMGLDAEPAHALTANNATIAVIAAVLALVAVTPLLMPQPRVEPSAAAPSIAPYAPGDFSQPNINVLVQSAGNDNFTPVVVQPPALQGAPRAPRLIAYPVHQTEDR